ncbi:hypothetical protein [Exiguobacterium algae]|uniref:hypothetical protein n=1 Tax=Exiguobacterium algae TaxID=2751250 RepID=UPI001BEBE939|nr:hypothetical protein [Exiguobacterium algae]
MRYVVTCFLVEQEECEFIVYGSSKYDAIQTFEQTLKMKNPMKDHIDLSDGRKIEMKSILAFRVDPVKPLF